MSTSAVSAIYGFSCEVLSPQPLPGQDGKYGIGVSTLMRAGGPAVTITIRHERGHVLTAVLSDEHLHRLLDLILLAAQQLANLADAPTTVRH